jgi:hypothetical protein
LIQDKPEVDVSTTDDSQDVKLGLADRLKVWMINEGQQKAFDLGADILRSSQTIHAFVGSTASYRFRVRDGKLRIEG